MMFTETHGYDGSKSRAGSFLCSSGETSVMALLGRSSPHYDPEAVTSRA